MTFSMQIFFFFITVSKIKTDKNDEKYIWKYIVRETTFIFISHRSNIHPTGSRVNLF